MVSNDVDALEPGAACPALLLTAKARVIAPVVVLRHGEDDFLVLTEPELGEVVRAHLVRMAAITSNRPVESRFRLAVDRVFTLAGIGVIVTGTVLSGSVKIGDHVRVSPSGLAARVRSIHAQNRPADLVNAARADGRTLAHLDDAELRYALTFLAEATTGRIRQARIRVIIDALPEGDPGPSGTCGRFGVRT